MIVIQRNKKVVAGDTQYGKYQLSEAGKAIGSIPGWGAFYDAEHYTDGERAILNRVNGKKSALSSASFEKITSGGQQILKRVRANPYSVAHVGDYDIGNEFTFFVVGKLTAEGTTVAGQAFRLVRRIQETSDRSLHLSVTTNRSRARQLVDSTATSNSIIEFNLLDAGVGDEMLLIMFTYNNGVVGIRVNGAQGPTGSRAPIIDGLKAGEWDWFRNANGEFAAWGGLNIDLSKPSNAVHLRALESYFMEKYGIRQL